ncbi:sulfotransferase domain-containing protein [Bacillus sp. NTK071]|nr:sulfotransferase domain-containing protein [Bacillus sp. NTK071]MBN8207258.1 sulfotransferase domain-containing protein [Bacillus sp. NTK071]
MPVFNNEKNKIPGFLLNSVPKSGTHLLKQILLGLPETFHIPGNVIYEGLEKDHNKHLQKMKTLRDNEIIMGHIYYSERWAKLLSDNQIKQVFIIRDLRDVVVSLTYFIKSKLPDHPLYPLFTQSGTTQKDCYLSLINGVKTKDTKYGNIVEFFHDFRGWVNHNEVLTVTYEELMESAQSRHKSLKNIAQYLTKELNYPLSINEMINHMEANILPSQSPTFRKGSIGSWREEFDDEVKEAFKKVAGDLLIQLGYEKNHVW